MFFESLKYFNIKEKVWLFCGSIADRVMMLMPQHIFVTRNFIETLKQKGHLLSENNSQFQVTQNSGTKYLLRRGTSDLLVFNQIIIREEFKNVVDLIKKNNILIRTIFDAGSNIGLTTIYLKQVFSNAKVICVEPDEDNLKQLHQNLDLNNLNQVEVIHGGVWSHNGWMDMDFSNGDGREWARSLKMPKHEMGHIPVFTISEILREKKWDKIDFLKMDIEGGEKEIFANLQSENLKFLTNTQVVTIEVHDHYVAGHKIIEALLYYNFKIFFSGELLIGIKR